MYWRHAGSVPFERDFAGYSQPLGGQTINERRDLMAEYTLPGLDYGYGALEPHISGQINELHHPKHHATYVKGANDALAKLAKAREKGDHSAILLNEKNLAFNLGGHVNHSIWWKNLSPDGGDKPTGALAAAIDDAFGSFDAFRAQFAAAATACRARAGPCWAMTASATSC
jgi:Fe-Mn family superoxide dismutase